MSEVPQRMRAYDIELSGQRMHYWRGGTGPALLLLHAAWGDAELSWSRVWDELARSYTVIAPDLPGFGRSDALSTPALSGVSTKARELLRALQQESAAVVGNSMGAAVAVQLENDHRSVVSRLVLVNGGYMPVVPGPLRSLISLPGVNQVFRALIRTMTCSTRTLMRSFGDPAGLPQDFLDTIRQNTMPYSRISFDLIMNHTKPLAPPAVPTLLLWGAQDGLATLKQAEVLQKRLLHARLVMIDGAGHMPQVEKPEAFFKAITAEV